MPKVQAESRVLHEILAIALIGLGALLLLAMVSYDDGDLSFYKNPPNDPVHNFIGPVGARVAWMFVFTFGFAAFLLPLILMASGICLIFAPKIDYRLKLVWLGLILLSGSGLLQLLQPVLGLSTPRGQGAGYIGGFAGYGINDWIMVPLMGAAGAGIVLTAVYVISLILLFEIRPVDLIRRAVFAGMEWYRVREENRLAHASPLERLEHERKKIEKQEKALRKKMVKEGLIDETPEPAPVKSSARAKEKEAPAPDPIPVPAAAPAKGKIVDTNFTPVDPDPVPAAPEPVAAEAEPKPASKSRKAPALSAAATEALAAGAEIRAEHDYSTYTMPSLDLLDKKDPSTVTAVDEEELHAQQALIIQALAQFGVVAEPGDITRGATITRYELKPDIGVRVEKIAALDKNIARSLKAERINILAPIPGKDTVGVEVPNAHKVPVLFRELLESDAWRSSKAKLPIALGKDIYGKILVADLAEMPHLLIAGTTGSGKSVCINAIILSMVYRFRPDELKMILVDPKVVEMQIYNKLPHLVIPVVTDSRKVLVALGWAVREMERRYRLMAQAGVRNINGFNTRPITPKKALAAATPESDDDDETNDSELPGLDTGVPEGEEMPDKLPYVVVIIDEVADLMQTARADAENAIARLAAKARAAGIHLVLATQTPRKDVLTGIIKTNVPSRISFQVPTAIDSRVILDEVGAENLLGKGDMLYLPPGSSKLMRAQGGFLSDAEVARVVDAVGKEGGQIFEKEIHAKISRETPEGEEVNEGDAELLEKCWDVLRQERKASTSLFQRRLRIGYGRASWAVDFFEKRGILGPSNGAKDRDILVDPDNYTFEP